MHLSGIALVQPHVLFLYYALNVTDANKFFPVCSTASSHSHDSPAPNHVTAQLFNILDEPLAESAAAPQLQAAPPSIGWDAFAAPSGPSAPESMSWSAFDNGPPVLSAVTNDHQQPQQQQQQQQPDMSAAWAAFGDSSSQPQQQQQQQFQQPQQTQQQLPQQQQQQQQPQHASEPAAAPQPPKPAARQELPLVRPALHDLMSFTASHWRPMLLHPEKLQWSCNRFHTPVLRHW